MAPEKVKFPAAKSNKHGVLPLCAELGLAFIPHGALGGHQARKGSSNGGVDLVRFIGG